MPMSKRKMKRVATLTADATLYEDSVQLNYKRRGFGSLACGPPKTICPPIERLKKGVKILLTLEKRSVVKVELVEKK